MLEGNFDYLTEEEISRKALEFRKSDNYNKRAQLGAFLRYGENVADTIDEIEDTFFGNEEIRNVMDENTGKGEIGRMMNFLKEYEASETWTDTEDNVVWDARGFDIEKIRKIHEVVSGFDFDY